MEDKGIRNLIKVQNKEFGTEDGIIERGLVRDKGKGNDQSIRIFSESLRLLRVSKGVIKYGLNQCLLIEPLDNNSIKSILPEGGTN